MPHRTFKYRLYPNKPQTEILEEQLQICRDIHNWLLHYAKSYYKDTGKTISYLTLQNLLPKLKTDRPELLKVHSQVLQNIARRIRLGYDNFFARRKAGLKAGLPRYKKHGRYKSITYARACKECFDSSREYSVIYAGQSGTDTHNDHLPGYGHVSSDPTSPYFWAYYKSKC